MTSKWTAAVALGLLAISGAGFASARARIAAAPKAAPPTLESGKDKLSYGMGVAVARTFQRQGAEIDVDVLARGMRDAMEGKRLLVPEAELRAALGRLQGDMKQKYTAARSAADASKKAGRTLEQSAAVAVSPGGAGD
jgi:FKBP-type peptidyl-prolyl cis-trans isomerase